MTPSNREAFKAYAGDREWRSMRECDEHLETFLAGAAHGGREMREAALGALRAEASWSGWNHTEKHPIRVCIRVVETLPDPQAKGECDGE